MKIADETPDEDPNTKFVRVLTRMLNTPRIGSSAKPKDWPRDDEIEYLVRQGNDVAVAIVDPRRILTVHNEDPSCIQCKHTFANHVYVADVFRGVVPYGGHVWCPCKRCPCHRSWAVHEDVGFDVRAEIKEMTRQEAIALGVPLRA